MIIKQTAAQAGPTLWSGPQGRAVKRPRAALFCISLFYSPGERLDPHPRDISSCSCFKGPLGQRDLFHTHGLGCDEVTLGSPQ